MALNYLLDAAQRLVTISGDCADPAEWNVLLGRILNDPRHQPPFGFLRDLRQSATRFDDEHILGVFRVVRHFWPLLHPSRAAIVLPSHVGAQLLANAKRMATGQQWPLGIFTSYPHAIDWLQANEVAFGSAQPALEARR